MIFDYKTYSWVVFFGSLIFSVKSADPILITVILGILLAYTFLCNPCYLCVPYMHAKFSLQGISKIGETE